MDVEYMRVSSKSAASIFSGSGGSRSCKRCGFFIPSFINSRNVADKLHRASLPALPARCFAWALLTL
ncbi:hypothetical protein GCK72_002599 [Caenorhabditis remanei]|uniref:Uncharacterized protein n=1 Tax=Caenorhabditis remanei TaxID=31234 RepID=A0A6A5HVG4_CAERE|nr:hypothetical protein GCK72_002599 [Caenorhabditis remanei]KAF1770776.1 hypothetical protein GCK72_002599 [Caenorhabditis remanei]